MPSNSSQSNRRRFIKNSAAGIALAASAPAAVNALGANEKVRVGFIGVGNRGTQLLRAFMKQDDVQIAALCDVYMPYLMRDNDSVDQSLQKALGGRIPQMGEAFENEVKRYQDFRKLLEQDDIDAVVIATPDHWHAVQTVLACQSGKDIYVEKPLSITVVEGRAMVNTVKKTSNVVQVGLHRRSSNMYRKAHEILRAGTIGKVSLSRAYRISNMYPDGIGKLDNQKPPEGLDWDLWLGPRGQQHYQDNVSPYKFRWWKNYSSQMANWGVHYCDTIRWMLDETAPASVSAYGGRYALDDDRTIPDTMDVTFEFASGSLLKFGVFEACAPNILPDGEIEFSGTLGNLVTGSEGSGYFVKPTGGGQFQDGERRRINEMKEGRMDGDLTEQHVRNFVDCVKARKQCNCDIETAHRSTTFAHLANLSIATKNRLEWDAEKEIVTNNDAANELLHYEYRKPWTLDM